MRECRFRKRCFSRAMASFKHRTMPPQACVNSCQSTPSWRTTDRSVPLRKSFDPQSGREALAPVVSFFHQR